jgi:4-hydroxy-tetrahydrodipicolinate reductase
MSGKKIFTGMLRIGLIGARGRMGKAIAAIESPDITIGAFFTREHPPVPEAEIDLFLDVSSAAALEQHLNVALLSKKPIVVGTTGNVDFDRLKTASRSIPVFYSANFSLGMALMRRAAEEFARHFHPNASIEIVETHHAKKKDAPSGAALMLSQSVQKTDPSQVKIRSIRSGDIVGKHEIHFRSPEESLVLEHIAHSRDAFARGSLEAARFLAVQSPGFYTMDDLIG